MAHVRKGRSFEDLNHGDYHQLPYCRCGRVAFERTSCTDFNPARRFLGCCRPKKNGGCDFFQWSDPEVCARGKQVVPGLLRTIRSHERELTVIRAREKKLRVMLILSWVLFLAIWGTGKIIGDKEPLALA